MNKTTKGATAAVAAGVLLLGGAGSLAYWTGTADVEGGDVTAGELKLLLIDCDDDWTLDDLTPLAGRPIVPGDSVTKVCTYTIKATGPHLTAGLAVDLGTGLSGGGQLDEALDASAVYKINNVVTPLPAAISSANNNHVLHATIIVDYAFGALPATDNLTQLDTATLDDITVTATQTDSH